MGHASCRRILDEATVNKVCVEGRQTDKQAGRQAGRQEVRQPDVQTCTRQTVIHNMLEYTHTHTHTHMHTHTHTHTHLQKNCTSLLTAANLHTYISNNYIRMISIIRPVEVTEESHDS